MCFFPSSFTSNTAGWQTWPLQPAGIQRLGRTLGRKGLPRDGRFGGTGNRRRIRHGFFASRGQEMYIDIDRLRHANVPAQPGSPTRSIYSSERKQPGKEGLKMNMKNGRLKQKHGIYNQPHRVQGVQSKKQFSLEQIMHTPWPLVLKLTWNPNIWSNEKRRLLFWNHHFSSSIFIVLIFSY